MADITLQTSDDPMGDYVIDRLVNYNNAAEGAVLPPRQQGGVRVPLVTGFNVIQTTSAVAGTIFTLAWSDINSANLQVDHYAIYYTLAGTNTQQPVGPFIANQSPAQILIPNNNAQTGVTFYIQTVLANGMSSALEDSPTTAGFTLVAAIQANSLVGTLDASVVNVINMNASNLITGTLATTRLSISDLLVEGMTLTNNSPGGGSIAWSACTVFYKGVSYSITGSNTALKYVYWTVGNTTFTAASTFSPSVTTFLIATNTAGVADLAWNKIGAGGIAGQHMNVPTLLTGINGSLFLDQITWTNNAGVGVTWSAGTATYRGITYSVSSGGSGASNIWIYWKLASPTVIQSASSFPTLGPDDFLVGINNSWGSPQAIGYFTPVIEVHDNTNVRSYHSSGAYFIYNGESNFVLSLARTAADSIGTPAAGVLNLANGTGAGGLGGGVTVNLAGANGRIQCTDIITNAGTPFTVGNLSGSASGIVNDTLLITLAGVTVQIPVHV